jgi:urease gamma subunit
VILAISSPSALLAGIAVLSAGLLALSTAVLVADQRRNTAMRVQASETGLLVSRVLTPVDADVSLARELVSEGQSVLRELDLGGNREQFAERIGRGERLLHMIRTQNGRLGSAHDAALDLSVDEAAFLSSDSESDIAVVVALFQTATQLDDELFRARQMFGF